MKHLNIKILGKVQGVWYRQTTLENARNAGLKGVVMNEPDGSVYIEVEGDEQQLEEFVEYCKRGPENAEVSRIIIEESELKNFQNFQIIH